MPSLKSNSYATGEGKASASPLIFMWENFGPTHVDRLEAVAGAFPDRDVIGIEQYSQSATYAWVGPEVQSFKIITLFESTKAGGFFAGLFALIKVAFTIDRGCYFLCHYHKSEVLFFAWFLRLTGNRVFTMGDSKFDDYRRNLWQELGKTVFYLPYHAALAAGKRSADYYRFLGFGRRDIALGYDTLSVERIQKLSGSDPAPGGTKFLERDFICIARLVPKKNLTTLIDAFDIYRKMTKTPRSLVLCGAGPVEEELRREVKERRLTQLVHFKGFVQTEEISRILGKSLALILPSTEEQFGLVVIEALAMGLPIILSDNCGARDSLVRSGVNGFVVEPDNPAGIAYFLSALSANETLWIKMSNSSRDFSKLGDVSQFVKAVDTLCHPTKNTGK